MQQLSKNPFHHCIYSIKKMASGISGYFSFNSVHFKTQKQTNSLYFLQLRFMKITRLSWVWYRWKSKQNTNIHTFRETQSCCVSVEKFPMGDTVAHWLAPPPHSKTVSSLWVLGFPATVQTMHGMKIPVDSQFIKLRMACWAATTRLHRRHHSSQFERSELLPCAWVAICLCKQLNIYLLKSAWWVCVVDFVNWRILC